MNSFYTPDYLIAQITKLDVIMSNNIDMHIISYIIIQFFGMYLFVTTIVLFLFKISKKV